MHSAFANTTPQVTHRHNIKIIISKIIAQSGIIRHRLHDNRYCNLRYAMTRAKTHRMYQISNITTRRRFDAVKTMQWALRTI